MTDHKPREWWIKRLEENGNSVYMTEIAVHRPDMKNAMWQDFHLCYHVIEKSAYDQVVKERDELKMLINSVELREHIESATKAIKERDANGSLIAHAPTDLSKLIQALEVADTALKGYATADDEQDAPINQAAIIARAEIQRILAAP